MIVGAATLRDRLSAPLAERRTLPSAPALAGLVPALQRGITVGASGHGATSLALAIAAGPSRSGAWVGAVGLDTLGLAAAAEAGIDLERLFRVETRAIPARERATVLAEVVAAVIDGVDVVLLDDRGSRMTGSGLTRKLQQRAQRRGAILVVIRPDPQTWSLDLHVRGERSQWGGLGAGHGVASRRQLAVVVEGRRQQRAVRGDVTWPLAGEVEGHWAEHRSGRDDLDDGAVRIERAG